MNSQSRSTEPRRQGWSASRHLASLRSPAALARLAACLLLLAGTDRTRADGWNETDRLFGDLRDHTATVLLSGEVLVVGGRGEGGKRDQAQLYDPRTGLWRDVDSLARDRSDHTATLLRSGEVLIVGGGGVDGNGDPELLDSAVLYSPATGSWTATGSLVEARAQHTATLLPSGQVLVVGGTIGNLVLATWELYDPATGTWESSTCPTGSTCPPDPPYPTDPGQRWQHTATLLRTGKVLVAGGFNQSTSAVFDPATKSWSAPEALAGGGRRFHTATLLSAGKVLMVGGVGGTAGTPELYDPASDSWTQTTNSPAVAHRLHTATLLPSGQLLVAGGVTSGNEPDSVEIFTAGADPLVGTWARAASLLTGGRAVHSASLLPTGGVLVAGGQASAILSSVELYTPTPAAPAGAAGLSAARDGHTATLLPSGEVLVAGGNGAAVPNVERYAPDAWTASDPPAGYGFQERSRHTATLLPDGSMLLTGGIVSPGDDDDARLGNVDLYDSGSWSQETALTVPRSDHTATLLPSGAVLVTGGTEAGSFDPALADVELYDPGAGPTPGTALTEARSHHTATLLPSGRVLVVGGRDLPGNRSSVELYDPRGGGWSPSTATDLNTCNAGATPHPLAPCPLADARSRHTATLLPSGQVLVAGGAGAPTSAELYDPATGVWSVTGSLTTGRQDHTATLLLSGHVLVAGGDAGGALSSVEIYDPATGAWTPGVALLTARQSHTATLLPSGKVLLAGGSAGGKLSSVEIYDPQGVDDARRPVISTVTVPGSRMPAPQIRYGGTFEIEGTKLGGDSETGGGTTTSSKANFPVVLLRAVDGDEAGWLTLAPVAAGPPPDLLPAFCGSSGFCDGVPSTLEVGEIPPIFQPGRHLLSVVTAGVPSQPHLVELVCSSTIDQHPIDAADVLLGERATFTVATQGIRTFQWFRDGQPITGANGPGYTTPPVTPGDSGSLYHVEVDPACEASFDSNIAVLTVFDVTPPAVDVVSPDGGEYWPLSDPNTPGDPNLRIVNWEMSDNIRICQVHVELQSSDDGGASFDPVPPDCPQLPAGDPVCLGDPTDPRCQDPPCPDPTDPRCQADPRCRVPLANRLPRTFGPGGACRFGEGPTTTHVEYAVPSAAPSGTPGSLYQIAVTVSDHAASGPLDADSVTVDTSEDPFFIVSPNNGDVKTLILTNIPRMQAKMGISPTDALNLEEQLRQLAANQLVKGRLIDLSGVAELQPLYQAWDAAAVDDLANHTALANAVLFDPDVPCADDPCAPGDPGLGDPFGIHAYLLGQLLPLFTGVENLVLVGDDRIIPLGRLEDRARILTEEDYPLGGDLTAGGSTVGRALAADQYLSDDPLAVRDPVTLLASGSVSIPDSGLCEDDVKEDLAYLPDLAVGRLVETPSEIIGTIATFISQGGILDLSDLEADDRVLATGYDFLVDSGQRIVDEWQDLFPAAGTVSDTLVDPAQAWGTVELLAGMCGNGGSPYPIASLNGHANHYGEGVPGLETHFDDGLETSAITGGSACGPETPLDLSGAVYYAVGCHGGLPVPDDAPAADNPLDLPQAFLRQGVMAYVANTGYGWGLLQGPPGYGERMVVLMTEELVAGGTLTVGEAVKRTKTRYFAEDSGCFDAFDQKSLMQWTVFGLPMYTVQLPGPGGASRAAERPPRELAEWPEEERFGDVVVRRRGTRDKAALPNFLTRLDLSFDFSAAGVYQKRNSSANVLCGDDLTPPCDDPTVQGCADPDGCYYELNELASGQADLPVQPYFVFDSRLAGTSQHGVLWNGGVYAQEENWRPLRAVLQSNNAEVFDDLGALARRNRGRARPTRTRPGEDGDESGGCRPNDLELNTLVVPTGEAVQDGTGALSIERRDLEVNLEVFYFNDSTDPVENCDREGPVLGPGLAAPPFSGEYHGTTGTTIDWAVPVTDDADDPAGPPGNGVWRVVVVINDESASAWVPLELADADQDGTWTGSYDLGGAGELSYFLQAVDRRGNVTWLLFDPSSIPGEPAADSGIPSGLPEAVAVDVTPGNADLAVTLADSPDPVAVGAPLAYTLQVNNVGPGIANGVTATLELPATASFVQASGSGWGCSETAGTVTCDRPSLPVGAAPPVSVVVTAPGADAVLAATASVSAIQDDPVGGNDQAVAATVVTSLVADLELSESSPATAAPGQPIAYALTVTNHGPSEAPAVTVASLLPAELTGAATSGCANDPAGSPVCDLGTLASGATAQVTVTATIDPGAAGVLVATASAFAANGDPDTGNNTAAMVTAVGDGTPPTVVGVDTVRGTGDGVLEDCESVRAVVSRLWVSFSEAVRDPAGDTAEDDVTNPDGYRVLAAGADRDLETAVCGPALGDDVEVTLAGVGYEAASHTATLDFGGSLASGLYRLLVCGPGTIRDLGGMGLDGDGDGTAGGDLRLDFRIDPANLLVNGHFDCSLAGWVAEPPLPGEIEHSAEDLDGALASGSTRFALAVDAAGGLAQCVPVAGGGLLHWQYALKVETPSGGQVLATTGCEVYPQAQCVGSALAENHLVSQLVDSAGAWGPLSGTVERPDGAASVLCQVLVERQQGGDFAVFLDEAVLSGELFTDGFESGDTAAWSGTTGR